MRAVIGGVSAVIIITLLLTSVIAIALIIHLRSQLHEQGDPRRYDSSAQGHGDDSQVHDDDNSQGHEYETVILDVCEEDIQLNNNVAYSCVNIPKDHHLLPNTQQNY